MKTFLFRSFYEEEEISLKNCRLSNCSFKYSQEMDIFILTSFFGVFSLEIKELHRLKSALPQCYT